MLHVVSGVTTAPFSTTSTTAVAVFLDSISIPMFVSLVLPTAHNAVRIAPVPHVPKEPTCLTTPACPALDPTVSPATAQPASLSAGGKFLSLSTLPMELQFSLQFAMLVAYPAPMLNPRYV